MNDIFHNLKFPVRLLGKKKRERTTAVKLLFTVGDHIQFSQAPGFSHSKLVQSLFSGLHAPLMLSCYPFHSNSPSWMNILEPWCYFQDGIMPQDYLV